MAIIQMLMGGAASDSGIEATGGNATVDYPGAPDGNKYRCHIWTASGSLVVSDAGNLGSAIEYVVVAGGGGGSNQHSGAGGAGGYRSSVSGESTGGGGSLESAQAGTAATYPVTVGGGGAGSTPGPNGGSPKGSDGSTSTFALPS